MKSTIDAMKAALSFLGASNFVYPTHIADDLRDAIASEEAQTVESIGTVKQKRGYPEGSCFVLWAKQPIPGTELYTRPAPPPSADHIASGERVALIARIRKWVSDSDYAPSCTPENLMTEAADMLAADAQQIALTELATNAETMSIARELLTKRTAERDALRAEIDDVKAQQVAVLHGWKLVPTEPTTEMLESGKTAHYEAENKIKDPGAYEITGFANRKVRASHVYSAMLSSAPQPPQGDKT